MSRVAVVTSHLQPGDAVSNDVLGMCSAFAKRGFDARVYSESSDLTDEQVFNVSEIHEFLKDQSDLVVYHYSIGWKPGIPLLRTVKCRKAVKYHNITPPGYFSGISPWHEEKCREGLEDLKKIVHSDCDLFLADSAFNRDDLLLEGADEGRCFVVPPFHQIDRLNFIEADLETLDAYRDGNANILMIGRVAPHKKHDDLIIAFADYHHDYNSKSRLIIVGKEEAAFEIYFQRLRELASFLGVDDAVLFVGGASLSELKSFYLLAHVFAIASEHEGFCVPIIEAMSMKVPVVAYGCSAIPDTVDGAGVVLDKRNPSLMAEAIARLVGDQGMSFNLAMMGRRRYLEYFTNERIGAELFRALNLMETLTVAG
jgi:glycosyltransferase involved in cell wall biosynthesis